MADLIPQETQLIESLISSTNHNILKWQKDKSRGFNCFYCIVLANQKVLADKYYSVFGNETKECFNVTVLDASNKIVIEIVVCFEQDPGFGLLKTLYETVEAQYRNEMNKSISPILTQITGSLQLH